MNVRRACGTKFDYELDRTVCITAEPEEHELMNKALKDFSPEPLDYDISDMIPRKRLEKWRYFAKSFGKNCMENFKIIR